MKENAQNTSRNINITYLGKTQCLSEWSRELGISEKVLYKRAKKYTDPEQIFSKEEYVYPNKSTGVRGIYYRKGLYIVQAHNKYVGCRKTLEEAKELRNKYVE
jgi:hypothetical protein